MIQQSHSWAHIWRNHNWKRYIYPTSTAALFTTAKSRKQPKCSSEDVVHIKMEYYSQKS